MATGRDFRVGMGWRIIGFVSLLATFSGVVVSAMSWSARRHQPEPTKTLASVRQPVAPQYSPLVSVQPAAPSPAAHAQNWGLRPLDMAVGKIVTQRGHKFFLPEEQIQPLLMELLNQIPQSQFVDYQAFYILIKGLTGTTPREGIEIMRSRYIGKYYVLSGDAFAIQADNNYPEEGKNEFSLYGVMTLYNRSIEVPVNVEAVSTEKVPAYARSPILGKITGFELETSKGGFFVIVPQIKVVALGELSSCCESAEAVIINEY